MVIGGNSVAQGEALHLTTENLQERYRELPIERLDRWHLQGASGYQIERAELVTLTHQGKRKTLKNRDGATGGIENA
jgi:hypothetical protein